MLPANDVLELRRWEDDFEEKDEAAKDATLSGGPPASRQDLSGAGAAIRKIDGKQGI